jgi:hypothetical protein
MHITWKGELQFFAPYAEHTTFQKPISASIHMFLQNLASFFLKN